MSNLRDLIKEKSMDDASIEEVIKLLNSSRAIVDPEDVIDYVLIHGHKHRLEEGWIMRRGTKHQETNYAANHYPEQALFCALSERIIEEEFGPEMLELRLELTEFRNTSGLKRALRSAYGLDMPLDHSIYKGIGAFFDSGNENATVNLGNKFLELRNLVNRTREVATEICEEPDVKIVLHSRRIRFNDAYLKALSINYRTGELPFDTNLLFDLTHFIAHDSCSGLDAFRTSQVFLSAYLKR